MKEEACVTDSLAATTDMAAEALATADVMAEDTIPEETTAEDTIPADITAEDMEMEITAEDTTLVDMVADSRAAEHRAAVAHAPLLEQTAAVVADSVAAVPHVPAQAA